MRLTISKHIYAALSGSAEIVKAIGENKIFPIATKNEVEFPFIVYERETGQKWAKTAPNHRKSIKKSARCFYQSHRADLV